MKYAKGFSLIELMGVMSILAILVTLMVPAVGKVMEQARRASAANKLRQIALAVNSYQELNGNGSLPNTSIYAWIEKLCQTTHLNEATLFVLTEDPLLQTSGKTIPPNLLEKSGSTWIMSNSFKELPVSFTVITPIPVNAPASTTPILWTRGLSSTGEWNDTQDTTTPGIYSSGGGHIAFLDGHVQFYTTLNDDEGRLVNYQTGKPTANILEAIPTGSKVLTATTTTE
jgi:prepilin-type N-terminal cleavage/methylation domain-containing protein/prepilin-type processing-associated H-X9-DG protein